MSFQARVVMARRLRFLPHRLFAVVLHAMFQGEFSTLRRARTYSQLAAAKNLRPQHPLVTVTADKYAVRAHVAERIGERYLIPVIQVVERAEDLDFDALTEPCVIKGAHGCDMTVLLPDPATADHEEVRSTVRSWLETDFHRLGWRETQYRGIPRRVIVERFIGDGVSPPSDYKFFMFNGKLGMVAVDQDRFVAHTSTLLSPDWRPFDVVGTFDGAAKPPEKPAGFDEMVQVAQNLSSDFEFARIDLYYVDGRVYFGEITHFPGGGLVRLRPREFDLALGEMWRTGTPVPERFIRAVEANTAR
jgi:hypothetical protein